MPIQCSKVDEDDDCLTMTVTVSPHGACRYSLALVELNKKEARKKSRTRYDGTTNKKSFSTARVAAVSIQRTN
jgi:hypothetical protein